MNTTTVNPETPTTDRAAVLGGAGGRLVREMIYAYPTFRGAVPEAIGRLS
jgi:hypothetical protein